MRLLIGQKTVARAIFVKTPLGCANASFLNKMAQFVKVSVYRIQDEKVPLVSAFFLEHLTLQRNLDRNVKFPSVQFNDLVVNTLDTRFRRNYYVDPYKIL